MNMVFLSRGGRLPTPPLPAPPPSDAFSVHASRGAPPTPRVRKCLLTTCLFRYVAPPHTIHAPFYLYISISLQILVLFKLHQLFNFSSPSGGSGFRVAEQEKAEAFQGGFEIHGGLGCVPLTWAFWLPQTTELIKTHTRHFNLVWGESLLLRSTEEAVWEGRCFCCPMILTQ